MADTQIMPRWYGCSGCDGYCESGCFQGCYGCTGSCDGCSGCSSCKGTCTATCANSCNNNCTGNCTDTCNTACNTTCSGGQQTTNINALSANEILIANDMTKLTTAIKFEVVDRRKGSYTTVTFAAGDLIDDAKITTLIANLQNAGQTAAYSATAGNTALKVLLTDLIEKVKAANIEEIGLS